MRCSKHGEVEGIILNGIVFCSVPNCWEVMYHFSDRTIEKKWFEALEDYGFKDTDTNRLVFEKGFCFGSMMAEMRK